VDDFLSTLYVIAVLAGVLWLTWFVTRYIARRSGARSAGRFMRVVDRLAVGNDRALLLVKTGKRYCIVGVTGHEMRLIRTLDPDEAEAFDAAEAERMENRRGAENPVWNMQGFAERLGLAMKRRAKPQARQYPYEDEYDRDRSVPGDRPQEKMPDEQSVIDMMNERIRLRKESKWK
jgi:flagellar biosynthetic protein FliO